MSPIVEPAGEKFKLLQIFFDLVWRQFANADTDFGGMHEILAITQNCDDRNTQRVQEAHEFLETLGIPSRAIRDDCELAVTAIDFGNEQ